MELFMVQNIDGINLFSRSVYQEHENKQPWQPEREINRPITMNASNAPPFDTPAWGFFQVVTDGSQAIMGGGGLVHSIPA